MKYRHKHNYWRFNLCLNAPYKSLQYLPMSCSKDDSFFQRRQTDICFCYPPLRNYSQAVSKCKEVDRQKQKKRQSKTQSNEEKQEELALLQILKSKATTIKYTIANDQEQLDIDFDYFFPIDHNDKRLITSVQTSFPIIEIQIRRNHSQQEQQAQIDQGKLYVEIFLCEDKHTERQQCFQMVYSGLSGVTKYDVSKIEQLSFKEIYFRDPSPADPTYRLFIGLYRENLSHVKFYKDIYISKPLFIAEQQKIVFIDDKKTLGSFFDFFGLENISPYKLTKKSTIDQQMRTLQRQLIRENKKIMNILYLAYKFHNCCQVYFKTKTAIVPEPASIYYEEDELNQKDNAVSNAEEGQWFKEALMIMLNTRKQVEDYPEISEDAKLCCNTISKDSRIVFRIKQPLQRMKIVMAQEYGQFFSIVVGDNEGLKDFQRCQFTMLRQMYLEFHNSLGPQVPLNRKRQLRARKPDAIKGKRTIKFQVPAHQYRPQSQENDSSFNVGPTQKPNKEKKSPIVKNEEPSGSEEAQQRQVVSQQNSRYQNLKKASTRSRKVDFQSPRQLEAEDKFKSQENVQNLKELSKRNQLKAKKQRKNRELQEQSYQSVPPNNPDNNEQSIDFYELGKKYYQEIVKKECMKKENYQNKEKQASPKTTLSKLSQEYSEFIPQRQLRPYSCDYPRDATFFEPSRYLKGYDPRYDQRFTRYRYHQDQGYSQAFHRSPQEVLYSQASKGDKPNTHLRGFEQYFQYTPTRYRYPQRRYNFPMNSEQLDSRKDFNNGRLIYIPRGLYEPYRRYYRDEYQPYRSQSRQLQVNSKNCKSREQAKQEAEDSASQSIEVSRQKVGYVNEGQRRQYPPYHQLPFRKKDYFRGDYDDRRDYRYQGRKKQLPVFKESRTEWFNRD